MSRIEHDTSDEGLLSRFREGEGEAFTLLFRRYSKRLFGFVLGIVQDGDIADDVTQKVFVKLARRPEAFEPRASFSSWIHQVARNAALDAIKRRRNTGNQEGTEPGEISRFPWPAGVSEGNRPDRNAGDTVFRSLVQEAIQKLDGNQREALVLREYSELSYREIAEITGRTLASIKQDIYQARQFLRTELAPNLERMETE